MLKERVKNRLKRQKCAGLYRDPVRVCQRERKYLVTALGRLLNFASNDYLGLGASKILREKVGRNFKKYGSSSSSSRLVSGNFNTITAAEQAYADYFGYKAALFFPSGFQANLGVISALFEKGDILIFDKHVHASTVKGIELSRANFLGYNHNSMVHLEKRLKKNKGKTTAVISEALFSMDGDLLNIDVFSRLRKKYGFFTIIDEAHSLGALGKKGSGIADGAADIAVGTLGKAMGLFGAMVLLPVYLREYLINFSSPQIYTTTLPEAHGASCLDALEIMAKSSDKRAHLSHVSAFMRSHLKENGFKTKGDAHIIALEVGEETLALSLSKKLLQKGYFLFPARFPTVPLGKAILRISLTALHDEEDIRNFTIALKEAHGETEKSGV